MSILLRAAEINGITYDIVEYLKIIVSREIASQIVGASTIWLAIFYW